MAKTQNPVNLTKKLCLSTQQILHKKFEFNIISQYIYILRFKSHLVFYPWYEDLVDMSSPGAVWLSSPTWSSVVVLPFLEQCGCPPLPGAVWHCREWRTPKIPGLMATLVVLIYLEQFDCPGWRWHCREWRTPRIPGSAGRAPGPEQRFVMSRIGTL